MKTIAVMLALGVAIPVMGVGEASATPQRKYSSCDSYCQRFRRPRRDSLRMRAPLTEAASITRAAPTTIPWGADRGGI
jgi:hypothetical protein